MANDSREIRAIEGMALKVVERVSLVTPPMDEAGSYLRTKKEKMGHLLELV
jgi:3,4-dihydroxy 2-butanone 4-phosphate synthase / GTP cyclohydrolase II